MDGQRRRRLFFFLSLQSRRQIYDEDERALQVSLLPFKQKEISGLIWRRGTRPTFLLRLAWMEEGLVFVKEPGYEFIAVLYTNVIAALDRLNMLSMRRIRSNAVFIHQRDQVGLGQKVGRLSVTWGQIDLRRLKGVNLHIIRNLLIRPFIIDIDLEIVPLDHGQAVGNEFLSIDIDIDRGLLAQGILRHTSQKMPHNQLVNPGFIPCKCTKANLSIQISHAFHQSCSGLGVSSCGAKHGI
ncbi:hypothetical protein TCAL_16479 [Tigriopus californicus]|uniref:Uncharacterized protein n=1 Tax=Tigriopus californicus TaxID=6832 RepID=A0A553NS39_TIGCA|nr:hypothetical protein TCAL_16479 [Tigriopus californicus]